MSALAHVCAHRTAARKSHQDAGQRRRNGTHTATGRRAAALVFSVGLVAPTRRAGPAGAKAVAEAERPSANRIFLENIFAVTTRSTSVVGSAYKISKSMFEVMHREAPARTKERKYGRECLHDEDPLPSAPRCRRSRPGFTTASIGGACRGGGCWNGQGWDVSSEPGLLETSRMQHAIKQQTSAWPYAAPARGLQGNRPGVASADGGCARRGGGWVV